MMADPLRILIIADAPDSVIVKRALEVAGIRATTQHIDDTRSLAAALAADRWDLILADGQSPDMGLEQLHELLPSHPPPPPIIPLSNRPAPGEQDDPDQTGRAGGLASIRLLAPAIHRELNEARARRQCQRRNRALFQGEQRFRQLFEQAPVGMLLIQDQEIQQLNRAAEWLIGADEGGLQLPLRADRLFSDADHLDSLTRPPADPKTPPAIETDLQRLNGETIRVEVLATHIEQARGPLTQLVLKTPGDLERSQSELEHMARHDPLTDLPNRALFEERLEHAIVQAKREHNHLAVLFLDLDRFKNINDSLGHSAGDELLKQVARRISSLLRENDTAARLGGDEFTILAEDLDDPGAAALIAAKLQVQLKRPFEIFQRNLHITASIGISIYPEDGESVVNLTKNADAAMYQAKEQGRDNYRFYTAELTQRAMDRLLMEGELRTALAEHQLLLYYQPQYSIISGEMTGAEALLRWRHPRRGMVLPGEFVHLAEESGLIHEIGHWTLEKACEQTRDWSHAGLFTGRMAVNLSVRQLMQTDLILRFEEIIDRTACPPEQLQFEVTEGIFMGHKELSIPVLDVFKQLGVTIAIDDFGTGYSSLSYLKQLPIDKLKIDRSFVKDMPHENNAVVIAQAVVSLGQALGMEIIAEGVETVAQQELLRSMGCQEAQGFLYGKPMTAKEYEAILREDK